MLQDLLQALCVEQIEVFEDATSTLLVGELRIDGMAGRQSDRTNTNGICILHLLAQIPGQQARTAFLLIKETFTD